MDQVGRRHLRGVVGHAAEGGEGEVDQPELGAVLHHLVEELVLEGRLHVGVLLLALVEGQPHAREPHLGYGQGQG